MNKLWLIFQREYLTRVKKRSFIIATILTPLAFALFFVVVGFISSYESDTAKNIAVLDEGNILKNAIKDEGNMYFKFENESLESLKGSFKEKGYDGILQIPPIKDVASRSHTIFFYSEDQLSMELTFKIEGKIRSSIRDYKIEALNLDKKELDNLNTKVKLDPEPIDDSEEDASTMSGLIGMGIGGLLGMIMYLSLFIYGMMVMRSVMEEKMNRIVEVMISSVKPFQLMLGKILGVGAVGLTQVAIWAIIIPIMYLILIPIFGIDTDQAAAAEQLAANIDPEEMQFKIAQLANEISNQNWMLILPLFAVYFICGFLLYSSLFAAVGSAMGDDLGEGQALTIPITIPILIAFYIMIVAVRAPHSSLAVWSSIFPLFAPIVMPARLAFDPPLWQILLSVAVMIASTWFFIWLSGRIYRVGILMYGKKVSFRELGRWLFYKE